ncbi:hypothetical protein GCM10008938_52290 [Deinococcus roseus]|uniref:Uncharacterized protein n=1 Tax=Deinococcus roseus TaxID=392414 RepID=A0ABQ2DNB8_9DEIO|nr:hypothetical protein GCM10008938_52290 [Deinococcus roseus]
MSSRRWTPRNLGLPKIVKYSRGARPTDPEHLKEGEESVRYITLITCPCNGRPLEAYQNPEKVAAASP